MENKAGEAPIDVVMEQSNEEMEGVPSNLNLHQSMPTQVAVLDGREEYIDPISSVDDTGSIHFRVRSGENEMMIPNEFKLECSQKILSKSGEPISALIKVGDNVTDNPDDDVAYANYPNATVFKELETRLNNVSISTSDAMYMYRADIESKLFTSRATKLGALKLGGFYPEKLPLDGNVAKIGRWSEDPGNSFENFHGIKKRYQKNSCWAPVQNKRGHTRRHLRPTKTATPRVGT